MFKQPSDCHFFFLLFASFPWDFLDPQPSTYMSVLSKLIHICINAGKKIDSIPKMCKASNNTGYFSRHYE